MSDPRGHLAGRPVLRRLGRRLSRLATRVGRGRVFRPGAPRLVVHATHHKAGVVWFRSLFEELAHDLALRFELTDRRPPGARTHLCLDDHSRLDAGTLRPFAGSHMVRDPRDVVVSGYHYHRWAEEPWLHEPHDVFGGRSYQQVLCTLDRHEGLMLEIERFARDQLHVMAAWDYDDPRFLELRYEDLRRDEVAGFRRLFEHYGFTDRAVETGLRAAERVSFDRLRAREASRPDGRPLHLRSARAGQWRDELDAEHRARLKELAGDLIVDLGYEDGPDW